VFISVSGICVKPRWCCDTTRSTIACRVGVARIDGDHVGQTMGANIRSGSAEEMRQVLATDVAKWAKLVKDKNIKIAP